MRYVFAIAACTVLEARRNRFGSVLALLAAAALAACGFLGQLALTETLQLQAALLAAMLRLGAVFLVAAFVIASLLREANDKGLELLLALPMPRAAWLGGRLLGFGLVALLPALLCGALAALFAPPGQAALWALSLLCELWIMAAFSLLCALTLSQLLPALAASAAFYLLARSLSGLQLLAHGRGAIGTALDALALLLPRLDGFARTDWLVYHSASAAQLLPLLAQAAIYLALLGAAALFDLYRKNI